MNSGNTLQKRSIPTRDEPLARFMRLGAH